MIPRSLLDDEEEEQRSVPTQAAREILIDILEEDEEFNIPDVEWHVEKEVCYEPSYGTSLFGKTPKSLDSIEWTFEFHTPKYDVDVDVIDRRPGE